MVRSTRVAQALAPLLADDQVALPVPRYRPVVDVRAPARSTACPRSGAHNPPAGALLRAHRREGSTIPCSYEVLHRDGVWIHVHSRLVADRAPIGCWGASAWRPTLPRAPGLEAPADLAGRSAPGEVGHDTDPQNRVGIEDALLGTGAPACGHAPRLPPLQHPSAPALRLIPPLITDGDRPSTLAMRAWHNPDSSPAPITARSSILKGRRQPTPNPSQPGKLLTPYDTTHPSQPHISQ